MIRVDNKGQGSRTLLGGVEHPRSLYGRLKTVENTLSETQAGMGHMGGGDPNFGFDTPAPRITSAATRYDWGGNGNASTWVLGIDLTVAYTPTPDYEGLDIRIFATAGHAGFVWEGRLDPPFDPTITVSDVGMVLGGTYAVQVRAVTRRRGASSWSDAWSGLYFDPNSPTIEVPFVSLDTTYNSPLGYDYTPDGARAKLIADPNQVPGPDEFEINWYSGSVSNFGSVPGNPDGSEVSFFLNMQPGLTWSVKVRARYGRVWSAWSTPINVVVAMESPPPPAWLTPDPIPDLWFDPLTQTWTARVAWTHSTGRHIKYYLRYRTTRGTRYIGQFVDGATQAFLYRGIFLAGATYEFGIAAVGYNDAIGSFVTFTRTFPKKSVPPPPLTAFRSSDESDVGDWEITANPASTTVTVVDDPTKSFEGQTAMQYFSSVGSVTVESKSPQWEMKAGKLYFFTSSVASKPTSGTSTDMAPVSTDQVLVYNDADTLIDTFTVGTGTPDSIGTEMVFKNQYRAPASASYYRRTLRVAFGAKLFSTNRNVWWSGVRQMATVTDDTIDVITNPSKLGLIQTQANPRVIYNTNGEAVAQESYQPTMNFAVVYEGLVDGLGHATDIYFFAGNNRCYIRLGDLITLSGSVALGGVNKAISLLNPLRHAIVTKSAAFTADGNADVYLCGSTLSGFTATLPAANTCAGAEYTFKNTGTTAITVSRAGTDTIEGASTVSLSTKYSSVTLISDGVSTWLKKAST